ncbi:transaldolase [Tessaracoccus sp. MC1865]|uniref:transaldolase n=1 Tax=Tessaracoccus sp. MC1865 TaxID=2760310 RepID=UPI0015FFCDCA|nr:transaldolase [Tessaracoccus sp. MC1865]MBB1484266.1 transaldolase [Tessaracoccus sp. MC1865]QTO37282.1 transaldolase [Tessaracoccus sp. MC1865]
MTDRLKSLTDAGVSIWLDDLSRDRLTTGNLAELIATKHVVGVTTNPTIFAKALSDGEAYAEQLADLTDVDEAIRLATTTDVRDAADLFRDIYASSNGFDGRVSIEVTPDLAHDTDATVTQVQELYDTVGRENLLVKIPATSAGVPAIAESIGRSISVNVTLIFDEGRYREVMDAYLTGLETADAAGRDLSKIHSVASYFISRVDAEIDARLEKLGHEELKGKAAIANAQVALGAYEEVFGSERFAALKAKGANPQRPLWASTSTKDPSYPDTMYVSELVARGVVNTMPEKTLEAFADHGVVGRPMEGTEEEGRRVLREISDAGVDLADVFQVLEDEGVEKFAVSWRELQETVRAALNN